MVVVLEINLLYYKTQMEGGSWNLPHHKHQVESGEWPQAPITSLLWEAETAGPLGLVGVSLALGQWETLSHGSESNRARHSVSSGIYINAWAHVPKHNGMYIPHSLRHICIHTYNKKGKKARKEIVNLFCKHFDNAIKCSDCCHLCMKYNPVV